MCTGSGTGNVFNVVSVSSVNSKLQNVCFSQAPVAFNAVELTEPYILRSETTATALAGALWAHSAESQCGVFCPNLLTTCKTL